MNTTDPNTFVLTQLLPVFFLAILVYGVAEWAWVHFRLGRAKNGEYRAVLKGMGFMIFVGALVTALIGPFNKVLLSLWGAQLAPWSVGLSPLGWVFGFVVYELCYWLQHWLAHKVRLLWCLHAPHHAPNSINMFVGFNHSFLETLFYMPFFLGFVTALLGVHPVVVAALTFVDVVWGNMLHISDEVARKRWGILEKFMQTPRYHRAHHAQNIRYMDTNYNSITLLGDWLMGTLQPLDDREPARFGITRDVNTESFLDVHFGDFRALFRDLKKARGLGEICGYLFRAPGWQPGSDDGTVAALKKKHKAELQRAELQSAELKRESAARTL